MALNRELLDFLNAWGGVNKISDQYDDSAYRKLRNSIATERLKVLQDPEERSARLGLMRQRASYLGAMSQRVNDPYFRQRGSGAFGTGVYDDTPSFTTPPTPTAPAPAPDKTSALDLGDEDELNDTGTQPTQFAFGGGTITAPVQGYADGGLVDDATRERGVEKLKERMGGDVPWYERKDSVFPVPKGGSALGKAIQEGEMYKTLNRVPQGKGYADGGLVDDGDDGDEGGDESAQANDVSSEEYMAGANPMGPQYSYAAADDAVLAGLQYAHQAFALDQSAQPRTAVPDPAQEQQHRQRIGAYLHGAGAAPPSLMQQIYKKIDPEGKMSESQRSMAGFSAMYQFYMKKGRPDLAQKAAFGMLQAHRMNVGHYNALARAAEGNGHLDMAAQFAAKAFANIPNGKDIRVYKGADGRYGYEAVDDRTGQVIKKGILSPQDIGAWVTETTPDKFDALVYSMAGKKPETPAKPQKPAAGPKEPTLADIDRAGVGVNSAYEEGQKGQDSSEPLGGNTKHIASYIYSSNKALGPKDALAITQRLVDPKLTALPRPQVMDDGSRVIEMPGEDNLPGERVRISRDVWMKAMAMRGEAQHTQNEAAGKELLQGAQSRVANQKIEDTFAKQDERMGVGQVKGRRSPAPAGTALVGTGREPTPPSDDESLAYDNSETNTRARLGRFAE